MGLVITRPGRSDDPHLREAFAGGLYGQTCCTGVRVVVSPVGADFRGSCPHPDHDFDADAEFKLYRSPLHWPIVPGPEAWRLAVDLGFISERPWWWNAEVPEECWTRCSDPAGHRDAVHPVYECRIVWPQPLAYLWEWAARRQRRGATTSVGYARLTVLAPQPGDVNDLWSNAGYWGLDVQAGLVRRCLPSHLADVLASIKVSAPEQVVVDQAVTALWVGTTWTDAGAFGPAASARVYDHFKAAFDVTHRVHRPGRCPPI